MQLTMPIIADGLAGFKIDVDLAPDSSELAGIRLGPEPVDGHYIHIIQEGDDVICCNRQDCIRIYQADITQVFNTLSQMIEQLQTWERQLNDLVYNGGTLNDLICCSSPILHNPIFVLDEREIVFAMTDHPAGTVDPEWDYLLAKGRMPYNRVSAIYHDSDFKTARRASEIDNQPVIFQPPGMSHRGINFRIPDPSADAFLGTMVVVESDTPFTEGMIHLTRILTRMIVKWTHVHAHDHEMKNVSHLFADLLDGIKVDADEIAMTKSLNDLNQDFYILAVIPLESPAQLRLIAPVLEGEISRSLCFEYQGQLLMLSAVDYEIEAIINNLYLLAEDMHFRVGISYPFSDWQAMKSAFRQANIALSYSDDRLARLDSASAMNYLVSELTVTLSGSDIMHPALRILISHDRRHGTQYYETLFTFLKQERNLVRTAAQLFIHRNTLVYRLTRIQELTQLDLEDYCARQYLLFSFLCQPTGQMINHLN